MGEDRVELLKGIIRDLHAGQDPQEVKRRFAELVKDVSSAEIAEMERQLIAEGLPETEVKRLCDVHTQVFQEALDRQAQPALPPGHPIETMRREAAALTGVIGSLRAAVAELGDPPVADRLKERRPAFEDALAELAEVDKHFLRKEYQLFPVLEKRGIVAPPKVMWAIHDDVRALLKETRRELGEGDAAAFTRDAAVLLKTVEDMSYKEDKILYPMCLEAFDADDWAAVRHGEGEFGYALIGSPGGARRGAGEAVTAAPPHESGAGPADSDGRVPVAARATEDLGLALETGRLSPDQIRLMLGHLPVDVTFVDENDEVRYYSEGDRIFPRSPGVIGRKVQNCHPPKSVHVVQKILDSFRAGSKDVAEFWLELGGRFVHIRYFAVRDHDRRYRGTLEVVQDVTAIRKLEGQRRLLDW